MLNCLIDYIGIEGCGGVIPPSGLFVNSLPGIELRLIDSIADKEQVTFQGVWNDVQNIAARKFRNDIRNELNKRYKLKSVTESINIERKVNLSVTTVASSEYRGWTLELNTEFESYVESNLKSIWIPSLPLYLDTAQNTTIKIFDLDTQTEIYTQDITGVAGWNEIAVNRSFTARRIYIAYDASLIDSIELNISKLQNTVNSYDCDACCLVWYWNGSRLIIKGASSPIADKFNITFGNNTFGLSGIFSINCSYDEFICNNLNILETAFWYLCGAELMHQRAYTSRLNEFTVFDSEKAKDQLALYMAMYKGGTVDDIEYQGELPTVMDGINLDMADSCLICNQEIRYIDAQL